MILRGAIKPRAMTRFPLLHIVFYLATLLMPAGTTKIRASGDNMLPVIWTLEGGFWHGLGTGGADVGDWKANDTLVSMIHQPYTEKVDVSSFVKVETGPNNEKVVTFEGHGLTVLVRGPKAIITGQPGGDLPSPLVITYFTK